MNVIIALALKGSILMIAAAAIVALLSRASAATRHFVWTLSVLGLLLLPVFAFSLPRWEIAVPIASVEAGSYAAESASVVTASPVRAAVTGAVPTTPVDTESSSSIASSIPWVMLAVVVYAVGVLALLGRLVVQHRRARLIAREATIVSDPEWTALLDECAARIGVARPVTLLRSRDQLMPMTMGTIDPVIVVPADADSWDEERRSAVLLHELAHIARRDCLTQTLCAIVSAVYWMHPGMWYVARRLRVEREVACDDRVLAAGAHAADYAGHLLELAYRWSGRRAPALVVGMAGSRKLEGRMRAVLDPERNRRAPSKRIWLAGTALAAAVLLPLAAMSLTAASARESFDEEQAARPQTSDRSIGTPDATSGTWEVTPTRTPGRVSLRVRLGGPSFNRDVDVNEIERLTEQRLPNDGQVRFSVPREAGSFEIEGTMKAGGGSGTFRFVPSQSFLVGLTGRGFAMPSAVELMVMAHQNLGFAFIDELAAQKYVQPLVPDLIRAAYHGVDVDFVRGVGQTGYRLGTLDMLIRFRDHGVDPEFIRRLRAQGVELAPDDLVRARDHGVDPEYVAGLKRAGYESLPFDALVRARDHGVDPEYLAALRGLGFEKQPLDEVIRVRDHGVDPEYVREMRRLGYTLTIQELITARDHGVTPDYIEAMVALGYKGLSIETLVRLRDHGVTPDYAIEAQKRGLTNLSPEEIIRMRDRGEASNDYHIDRLIAHLSEMVRRLERAFDKTMQKADHVAQKADKAAQKAEKAADTLSR